MKQIVIALTISASLVCVGCMQSKESSFSSSFSLRDLLTKNKSHANLDCGVAGGGGGNRFDIRSLKTGSGSFHSHKSDDCYCKIKPDALDSFDEEALMVGLAKDVERAILNSGAKIIDRGRPDAKSFYFGYVWNDGKGRVKVSGKRFPSDYYSLGANLEESGEVEPW